MKIIYLVLRAECYLSERGCYTQSYLTLRLELKQGQELNSDRIEREIAAANATRGLGPRYDFHSVALLAL